MIDLEKISKIYFVGIKGVAMSGLAVICKQKGIEVTGSDVAEKFITDKILDQHEIPVYESFNPENISDDIDVVVVGTSWPTTHEEVLAAKKKNISIISDSDLRGILSREKTTVAVTGIHGKTTTTAMLAHILQYAELQPSYLIGTGKVADFNGNSAWQSGEYFVIEGDEYARSFEDKKPKFLDLAPSISIITSIEWEHVDMYENLTAVEEAFKLLIEQTKDLIVACGDWPSVKNIISGNDERIITYGLGPHNTWQAYEIATTNNGMKFKVQKNGDFVGNFVLKIFGEHNVSNALACIIVAMYFGIDLGKISNALKSFQGTERRFDISQKKGLIFIDDYAHHPSEIKATLHAIKELHKDRKITCIFQPHMVSRTKALMEDFAHCFGDADHVIVADIFASAREADKSVTSKDLVEAVKKHHASVMYGGTLQQIADKLSKDKPVGIVVTMGAGDVYLVRDILLKQL